VLSTSLSENRKAEEVVDKLKPDELKPVVEVVQQSPECFSVGNPHVAEGVGPVPFARLQLTCDI
jgi:hypothetical protein